MKFIIAKTDVDVESPPVGIGIGSGTRTGARIISSTMRPGPCVAPLLLGAIGSCLACIVLPGTVNADLASNPLALNHAA